MKIFQNNHFLRLASLLIALLLLSACGANGDPSATSADQTDATASTEAVADETTYTINVLDALGAPVKGAVVEVLKNGTQEKMKVAKEGSASFTLPKGDYTVSVSVPNGNFYHAPALLSDSVTEITVQLFLKTNDTTEEFYAISPVTHDAELYSAKHVTEGYTYVELTPNDMQFFVFRPTREGVYKFSFLPKSDISIGFYGSPLTVAISDQSRVEVVDNSFELEIRKINIGTRLESTTPYVIGFYSASEAAKDCVLTVERIGDPPFNPVDVEWMYVRLSSTESDRIKAHLSNNPIPTNHSFKDLDITSANLTVVYNETDGFYHYNTADGPVVFVRIGSDSPYTEDFIKICETDNLGRHFYDADGNFLRKESYNLLFQDYAEISTEADKTCPLNKQMADALVNIGEANGWWKLGSNTYLFADTIVHPENAWLFACGYYAE